MNPIGSTCPARPRVACVLQAAPPDRDAVPYPRGSVRLRTARNRAPLRLMSRARPPGLAGTPPRRREGRQPHHAGPAPGDDQRLTDARVVLGNLQRASRDNHLTAFQRALAHYAGAAGEVGFTAEDGMGYTASAPGVAPPGPPRRHRRGAATMAVGAKAIAAAGAVVMAGAQAAGDGAEARGWRLKRPWRPENPFANARSPPSVDA